MTATTLDHWPPRVWVLLGHKAGDNHQLLALAGALGWPCEHKQLVYRSTELLTNLLLGGNLAGVNRSASSPLQPPWPDLVLTAGRRNEPVARWIQRQADGRTRLVHVGRPWARLDRFDLIVTTPQYQLPARANVLYNALPLHHLDVDRLAAAAAQWAPQLVHLPHPWFGLLVGGPSGPYRFSPATGERLGRAASELARSAGGALLVTTSARTPPATADALLTALTVPYYSFRWTAGSQDNPYFGYLALADAFIVTSDSISMLAEACATGQPVHIFDLAEPATRGQSLRTRLNAAWQRLRYFRHQVLVHWLLMRIGPRRMRREVRVLHERLCAEGRATWLGQSLPVGSPPLPPLTDLPQTVARVQALFVPPNPSRVPE